MQAMPAILLIGCQVALGLFLGFNYLNGDRNKPTLIGIHLLMGAAALEVMALLLRGAPNGDPTTGKPMLTIAAGLTAAALLGGLAAAIFIKDMPRAARVALYGHVGFALAGFGALVLWVAQS